MRRNSTLCVALVLIFASGALARPQMYTSKYPIKIHQVPGRQRTSSPRKLSHPSPRADAPSPAGQTYLEKNGVRLVLDGGEGPRGRLEVSFRPFVRNDNPVEWWPVCGASFNELKAQQVCELLGYQYGRQYYSLEAVYPSAAGNWTRWTAMDLLYCNSDAQDGGRRRGRALQTVPLGGDVDASPTEPYQCYAAIHIGSDCPNIGPFAAVECSSWPFPPAPPSPPKPPAPPPPPVSKKDTIRLIGGMSADAISSLEPNLCAGEAWGLLCQPGYSRVEVLVADASGSGQEVWSPVCYPEDATLRQQLAKLVCEQFHYYPWAEPVYWYIAPVPGDTAFPMPRSGPSSSAPTPAYGSPIPAYGSPTPMYGGKPTPPAYGSLSSPWGGGPSSFPQQQNPVPGASFPHANVPAPGTGPGGFIPGAYTTYTSFEGGVEEGTYYLQQTSLKLSSAPCDTGLMALQCWVAIA